MQGWLLIWEMPPTLKSTCLFNSKSNDYNDKLDARQPPQTEAGGLKGLRKSLQGGTKVFILLVLLAVGMLWILRTVWPVSGLSFVDSRILAAAKEEMTTMKIIDVRDAVDYQKNHYPGSINISLGRLPFVWRKELSPGEPVLILADSRRKSIKAARVLRSNGFSKLFALRRVNCA